MKRTARFIALALALALLGAISCKKDDDDAPRPVETWVTAAPREAAAA